MRGWSVLMVMAPLQGLYWLVTASAQAAWHTRPHESCALISAMLGSSDGFMYKKNRTFRLLHTTKIIQHLYFLSYEQQKTSF